MTACSRSQARVRIGRWLSVELLPNALSFRIIATIDLTEEAQVPIGFTGRVRFGEAGHPTAVGWYARGVLDDPARSVPAYVRLRTDGRIKQARHYRNGRLHDPAPGHAAVMGYFADGSRRYAEHYHHGRRQDGADGTPAITKWRADGSVRSIRRYPRVDSVRPWIGSVIDSA